MNEPAKVITTSSQEGSGYSTDILKIDGKKASGSSFVLLPGWHSVEVACTHTGAEIRTGVVIGALALGPVGGVVGAIVDRPEATRSPPLLACFIARPGRTYEVRAFAESGVWQTEVFDQESTYVVKSPCKPSPKGSAGR